MRNSVVVEEVMPSIPSDEKIVIGADLNGHAGIYNRDEEDMMGRFDIQA